MKLSLANATSYTAPFPHVRIPTILEQACADAALAWLKEGAPWRLRIENFYEQYEVDLRDNPPPAGLAGLVDDNQVHQLRSMLGDCLGIVSDLDLVSISCHMLIPGQTIRVHNDYIGREETHRVLIQLNSGWSVTNGGLLLLFGSDCATDIQAVIMPMHGSGFAFEISPNSFHAVSTIHSGSRYTLVYTFRTKT